MYFAVLRKIVLKWEQWLAFNCRTDWIIYILSTAGSHFGATGLENKSVGPRLAQRAPLTTSRVSMQKVKFSCA
jgi:hypothetical protein